MDNIERLEEICMRLDHLEQAGEWISRAMATSDSATSHTGTLVTVLAEEIRDRLIELVQMLEAAYLPRGVDTVH